MSTPNPTPAREAVEIARNDLALRIAMDVLGDMGRADGLAEWLGRDGTDLGQAVARLITAARADERAQLAARATDQAREMVEALRVRCGICHKGVITCKCEGQGCHRYCRAGEPCDYCGPAATTLLAALTAARERAIEDVPQAGAGE